MEAGKRTKAIIIMFAFLAAIAAGIAFFGLQVSRAQNDMVEAIDMQMAYSRWDSPIEAPAWCGRAQEMAADKALGYSDDNVLMNPDVDSASFVYYALSTCSDDRIAGPVLDSALERVGASGSYPAADMQYQATALEDLGFAKHEFSGFDDPYLLPGSVLYAVSDDGEFSEAGIFLGNYDLSEKDVFGNPMADQDEGMPIVIGAWASDGDAMAIGDQGQSGSGCWLEGEVSGQTGIQHTDWTIYYTSEKFV